MGRPGARRAVATATRGVSIVSRAWDAAVPFDAETKARIGARLEEVIKRLWMDGAAGRWQVAVLAGAVLAQLTLDEANALGATIAPADLRRLCKVPESTVKRFRPYRIVGRVSSATRKSFEDKRCPARAPHGTHTSCRARSCLATCIISTFSLPGQTGRSRRLRAIAWMDAATHRVRLDLILPEKGRSVRREHVARSFIAMTTGPRVGAVPRTLYPRQRLGIPLGRVHRRRDAARRPDAPVR